MAHADERNEEEEIVAEGRCIFSRSYDTGGMAGGGHDAVFELNSRYAISSLDFGTKGPYASFSEAAHDGEVNILHVANSTTDFRSPVWSAAEIIAKLSLEYLHEDEEPVELSVNDETWTVSRLHGWSRS